MNITLVSRIENKDALEFLRITDLNNTQDCSIVNSEGTVAGSVIKNGSILPLLLLVTRSQQTINHR